MHQTKFIKLLSFLSGKELKAFKLFTDSPFHNTNKSLHQLNLAILHYYEKEKPLNPERIWKRAFLALNRPYKSSSFNQELSKLYQLLEQFLIVSNLLNDKAACQNQLRLSFYMHGADEQFEKISLQTIPSSESNDWKHHQQALNQWHDLYSYPSIRPGFQDRTYPYKIQAHLDVHYFLMKLKYGLDLISISKTYNEPHVISLLQPVMEATKNAREDAPLLFLYRQLILLNQDFDLPTYDFCRDFYFENFQKLPKAEASFVLIKLLNLAFEQILNGYQHLDKVCLKLYQFGLDKQMVTVHNKMAVYTYINIVIYGASTQAFEFTEKFITDYQFHISEDVRETVVNLAVAYLAFYQKNYSEALHVLNRIVTNNIIYKVRIGSLSLRICYCLYEQNQINLKMLTSKIDAFDKYIIRDEKIAKTRIPSYENYLFLIKQLIRFKKGNISLVDLTSIIHKTTPIVAKNWFLQKLEELKQG